MEVGAQAFDDYYGGGSGRFSGLHIPDSLSPAARFGGCPRATRCWRDWVRARGSALLSASERDRMRRSTTQVRSIRANLLTALSNAPAAKSDFCQAEMRHGFG